MDFVESEEVVKNEVIVEAQVKPRADPGFSVPSRADSLFSDSGLLTPDSCNLTPSNGNLRRDRGATELTAVEIAIMETTRNIHNRHPAVRSCGPKEIQKALQSICNKYPRAQRLSILAEVDENHKAWCDCDDWRRDGGQYAKGLANWLAPTMDRWNTGPATNPQVETGARY